MTRASSITVLWLASPRDGEAARRAHPDVRHVETDPERIAAAIAMAIGDGPTVAVVADAAAAQRALGLGVDEVVIADSFAEADFATVLERASARSRGRVLRDLYLVDLVRRDDSLAMELFASALGRNLGGPLAEVEASAQELLREVGGAAGDRLSAIVETLRQTTRAVEALDQLVDPSSSSEVVDLATVVEEVTRVLGPMLRAAATLQLDLQISSAPVRLPRWQATQIVAAVLGNAAEALSAAPSAPGAPPARIELRLVEQLGAVVLEVTDSGAGMPAEVRERALDAFFTTRAADGRWGLGLSTTRARVERAGGGILVDSEPGQGTTVRIFLPLVEVGTAPGQRGDN